MPIKTIKIRDLLNKTLFFFLFCAKRLHCWCKVILFREAVTASGQALTVIPFLQNTITLWQTYESVNTNRTKWIFKFHPNLIKVRFRLDFQSLFRVKNSSGPLDDHKAFRATRLSVKSPGNLRRPPCSLQETVNFQKRLGWMNSAGWKSNGSNIWCPHPAVWKL